MESLLNLKFQSELGKLYLVEMSMMLAIVCAVVSPLQLGHEQNEFFPHKLMWMVCHCFIFKLILSLLKTGYTHFLTADSFGGTVLTSVL